LRYATRTSPSSLSACVAYGESSDISGEKLSSAALSCSYAGVICTRVSAHGCRISQNAA
jgi:hypothetical protein